LGERDGLASTGQGNAGDDPAIAAVQACLLKALIGGGAYGG
jgi:hypothetical protein